MRMGWDGLPRYLGCTAFSDWEHQVVVVAEARGLDWTGLLDILLDVRGSR